MQNHVNLTLSFLMSWPKFINALKLLRAGKCFRQEIGANQSVLVVKTNWGINFIGLQTISPTWLWDVAKCLETGNLYISGQRNKKII